MTEGENATTQTQPGTNTTTTPPQTPPAATQTTPTTPAKTEPAKTEPKRVRLKGGEDEVPEDAEIIEMTPRALASRLGRMTKAQLKELFGTDDIEKIKQDQAELKTHREEKEKARVEALSKEQRLAEEKSKAEERARSAETALKTEREDRTFERQDAHMVRMASKHIDEDHVDVELRKFAKHLVDTYKPRQLEKLKGKALDEAADKYFRERVAAKPKIGKDYDSVRREELKAELRGDKPKVKVTNGAGEKGQPPDGAKPKDGTNGAVVPGKLPPKEFREYKRKAGYNW